MSLTLALLLLFVVAPFLVAGLVIGVIAWTTRKDELPVRTSTVLRTGRQVWAEVIRVRNLGSVLDVRPMVEVTVRIADEPTGNQEVMVTQAMPRRAVRRLRPGAQVELRVLAEPLAAAIVLPDPPTGHRRT
ncbi:MAG: hypothetical protein NVS3B12_32950 [Acidimicrobiales bacterium]